MILIVVVAGCVWRKLTKFEDDDDDIYDDYEDDDNDDIFDDSFEDVGMEWRGRAGRKPPEVAQVHGDAGSRAESDDQPECDRREKTVHFREQ